MTPFDRALMRRSFALSALLIGVATGIVVATDEPFSTLAMRLARLGALAPALAALACALTLAQAESRGETRALSALGASPWRVAQGTRWAGWAIGLLSIAAVLSPWADPRALFPVATSPNAWRVDGSALLDRAAGIRVAATGMLQWLQPHPSAGAHFVASRGSAALALGPLALAAPAWVSAPLSPTSRALGAVLAVSGLIVLLHAVAAQRIDPAWLVVGSAPLLAQTVWASRRPAPVRKGRAR